MVNSRPAYGAALVTHSNVDLNAAGTWQQQLLDDHQCGMQRHCLPAKSRCNDLADALPRLACCAAEVGQLLDVRELANADAVAGAQREHGDRQPGAAPAVLVAEGPIALDHYRRRHQGSFRFTRCNAMRKMELPDLWRQRSASDTLFLKILLGLWPVAASTADGATCAHLGPLQADVRCSADANFCLNLQTLCSWSTRETSLAALKQMAP